MVGEYVRSLRAAAGMNQRQLAQRVGISASMLSLVESGRREPTIRLLRDIGKALEIPPAALLVVALQEESKDADQTPLAVRMRDMADSLFAAVQHSVVLRRLERARGNS